MKYNYSETDKKNLEWFKNDNTRASLKSIELEKGFIRSLSPFEISFDYPLSAISGKNCSGKSTLLAMCACAYHNKPTGYRLSTRKQSYYTFSDFFIQSHEDIPPSGVSILYGILHNKWKTSHRMTTGVGLAYQRREKEAGGRWTNYERRVNRDVIFLGIDRVVPPSEKSTPKNYKSRFHEAAPFGWETEAMSIVGRILNKDYSKFWYTAHSKYKLPVVTTSRNTYSGFNMGAGENAIFEILFHIFNSSMGSLIIIDEIELGLHEEAQSRLIDELKDLVFKRKMQIICTTHSPRILRAIPPKGRFYIENLSDETIISQGISPMFAAGMMAGENTSELDIFVEDKVAKAIIESFLDYSIRRRCNIIPIGSSNTIVKQMAARYRNAKVGECLAILDGDQNKDYLKLVKKVISEVGSYRGMQSPEDWAASRLHFLPGDTWPEKWILSNLEEDSLIILSDFFSMDVPRLKRCVEEALRSDKHSEFFVLSNQLNQNYDYTIRCCVKAIISEKTSTFSGLRSIILKKLDE